MEWFDDHDPPMPTLPILEEDIQVPWSKLLPGMRIRWKTQTFSKRGRIVAIAKRSLVVRFDAHAEDTVIPDAKWYAVEYCNGNLNEHLTAISTPAPEQSAAVLKTGDPDEYVSPREAATILGTDPKNIRRMIRDGRLGARRVGGRWVIERGNLGT
jgi:excisionase family DNA binding protein